MKRKAIRTAPLLRLVDFFEVPDVNPQLRHHPTENVDVSDVMATGLKIPPTEPTPKGERPSLT